MLNLAAVALFAFAFTAASSAALAQTPEELKRMSLEDLMNVKVTTASKIPEAAADVPAAVFVITQEDIRRSGARSIPEVLRLAPGLQVARINGGTWAIGIRGFADRLARSVLVLIDGRAVYSPLFAGTYWETQDTLLADIDRIEIIRGPGGTLWGANAVNGIINIITKSATETKGTYVGAGAGSEERAFGAVRYGRVTGSGAIRAYVKGFDRGPEFHPGGANKYDGLHFGQGGFRGDWNLAPNRTVTLQGDAYDGRLGERPTLALYTPPFAVTSNLDAPLSGANVLTRYVAGAPTGGTFQLQAYYDRTNRDEIPIGESRDTVDLDAQQTLRRWEHQTVTWGAGYRLSSGRITAVAPSGMDPARRTDHLFSVFAQDEIAVTTGFRVTVGSKFEHNSYSGFEAQPTVRALWTIDRANTIWGAVTRAVRTPSRVETDYTTTSFVNAAPTFVRLLPNPGFESEKLIAYELGYRVRAGSRLYVTSSAFFNDLRDTLGTDLLSRFVERGTPDRLILPVEFANSLHGNSQGAEITSDYRPKPWWRVTGNYSYVFVSMSRNPGSQDVSQERHYESAIPHHQLQAGTSFDVSQWSFNWLLRHVSELHAPTIPAYTASDVTVSWQMMPRLELSLVGEDLFDAHHVEWPSGGIEIQRSVYAAFTWRR